VVRDIHGLRIAIDARALVYRYAYDLPVDDLVPNLLQRLDRFLASLVQQGARQVLLVFDGEGVPAEKIRVVEERSVAKERTKLKIEVLKKRRRECDSVDPPLESKLQRLESAARGVPKKVYLAVIEGLEQRGHRCFVAESEADFALNYLSENRLVDAVLSDDADLLVAGPIRVLRNLPNLLRDGAGADLYDHTQICRHLRLTTEQLQELVCMIGCDYTKGIRGIGPVTALSAIRKFETVPRFLAAWDAKQKKRYSFYHADQAAGFLAEVEKSKTLFKWRPDTQRLQTFLGQSAADISQGVATLG
jgi:5'-3' exonuclease